MVPPSGPSRYPCEADRIHIADRLREKATIRAIAAELGRSPSTVSREIRRNRHAVNGQYRPYAAQDRADARRPRPKPGKIGQNPALRKFIQDRLDLRWSPEQICQALRANFPERPEMHVVHETVYQALYVQGRGELRRELARALRTGRTRRKAHRQAQQRQTRFSTPMVMISERPAEAEEGADLPSALEVLGGGLAGSTVIARKKDATLNRDFKPGFRIDLHHKDMGVVTDTAHAVGAVLPFGSLAAQLMAHAHAHAHANGDDGDGDGDGTLDHSAVLRGVERLSGRAVE
ncbi:IS30 family transposase [Streptomyces sp. NPDC020794]|uniref:IS30 family transposase n=1 Tax=unclassified Streptomyces TaxID=2593676 RepID=UPI0036E6D1FD